MDIREIVAGVTSSGMLGQAANQAGLNQDQAQDALHGVLEHFTNGGSMEGVAEVVAAKAGISQDQIQAFLPQVLPMLQAHSENAGEGVQSVIGGVLKSLTSGGGLGDLAKGLFR
ncbi:MAG TPA: hypothetical protein VGH03_09675 [Caulobacteraceae bacterium]|jgi:hypothetical protein